MFGKPRKLIALIASLFLLALSASVVGAQGPQPQSTLPNAAQVNESSANTTALRSAIALQQSLTNEQRTALKAVLDKYAADFKAIAAQLPDPRGANVSRDEFVYMPMVLGGGGATTNDNGSKPQQDQTADANRLQDFKAATESLKALQAKVDAEVASILNASQQADFQAGLKPTQILAERAEAEANAALSNVATSSDASVQAYYPYCSTAAYYGSYASYYNWISYYYAYYDYVYYGTTYGYYSYYYAYYGYLYTVDGLAEAAGGYFDLAYLGSDWNGLAYAGISDNYYAYYYSYYGSLYGYYDYIYQSGSTYAYYAYLYGYYGYNYAYYAYYYNYYCYYA